jgi:hypothetical protein
LGHRLSIQFDSGLRLSFCDVPIAKKSSFFLKLQQSFSWVYFIGKAYFIEIGKKEKRTVGAAFHF